jgi:hypothetical protein
MTESMPSNVATSDSPFEYENPFTLELGTFTGVFNLNTVDETNATAGRHDRVGKG